MFLLVFFFISLDRRIPEVQQGLTVLMFAGLVLLFALRRRAVTSIHSRIGTTATDALAVLNTPSWRASTWRRTPTAVLLSGQPAAVAVEPPSVTPATRVARSIEDERPTRLS